MKGERREANKVAERLCNTREYESSPDLTPTISKMSEEEEEEEEEEERCVFSEDTLKKAIAQLILCSNSRRRKNLKVEGRPEHELCVCQTHIEESEGSILGR